ncbi:MAG: OstA-like protein [Cytophagales bacterium]
MKNIFARIVGLLLLLNSYFLLAQSKQVELIRANSLEGTVRMGLPTRVLKGNVVFQHAGAKMYCDSSYQFQNRNDLEAFDHIKVIKSDSQKLFGDHMTYYGDQKLAKVSGSRVVLINNSLTLYTTILDYNLGTDIANYSNKGTVIDKENKLDSQFGTFYKHQNLFVFIKNVVFTDKKHTIYTDTLEYNTTTKIVKFKGPTQIVGSDGTMNSLSGQYNSITKKSKFIGRTHINYDIYILYADEVDYDQFKHFGTAKGNVEVFSSKDSVTIFGNEAKYSSGSKTNTKVYPEALMRSISAGDTLYLSSDTLYAVNDTISKTKQKKMFAYHQVKVFNKTYQAICDSLIYDAIDTSITFFKDPVLWSGKNQMRGDTIKVFSKSKKVDKVLLRTKAFSISVDTLANFNQVRGKNMTAFFETNKLKKIDVKANAETNYFALSGDTLLSGMNHVESEDLTVRFENQKLKQIAFYKKPKAKFIPPHELKDEALRLRGFKWRVKEKPDIKMVLGKYYDKLYNHIKK